MRKISEVPIKDAKMLKKITVIKLEVRRFHTPYTIPCKLEEINVNAAITSFSL
jgi:hypothetical protein